MPSRDRHHLVARGIAAGGGGATAPANTALPALPGAAPAEGVAFVATAGTWTGTPPITYARQWQRKLGAGAWANIGGATALAYTPVAGDVGRTLRLGETATNAAGSTGPVYSAASAVVVAAGGADFAISGTSVASLWGAAQVGTLNPSGGPVSPVFTLTAETHGFAILED